LLLVTTARLYDSLPADIRHRVVHPKSGGLERTIAATGNMGVNSYTVSRIPLPSGPAQDEDASSLNASQEGGRAILRDPKLSRCGVCGTLEAVDSPDRDGHFVEVAGGIWIHRGECLVRWNDADPDQRTEWSVQAIRWRDAA
jgi:hypothetical protein